eukprot:scaffold101389_cov115-Cyclotella_meneghiniana.AAC.1
MNLLSVGVLSETEDSGEISTSLWLIKSTVGDEIYSPPSSATQQDPSLFGIISRVGDGLPCRFACQKNRRSTLWRQQQKKKADDWNDSVEAVSEELDAVGGPAEDMVDCDMSGNYALLLFGLARRTRRALIKKS